MFSTFFVVVYLWSFMWFKKYSQIWKTNLYNFIKWFSSFYIFGTYQSNVCGKHGFRSPVWNKTYTIKQNIYKILILKWHITMTVDLRPFSHLCVCWFFRNRESDVIPPRFLSILRLHTSLMTCIHSSCFHY